MRINFDTDRLIVFNYPGGAGGKFITLCLALDPCVLHQDQDHARNKIEGRLGVEESFEISRTSLIRSMTDPNNQHFQFNDEDFAGFHDGHPIEEQEQKSTTLWRELTNQDKFYFCMTSHFGNQWKHYPNATNIIFKNYEWILDKRNKPLKMKRIYEEHFPDKERLLFFDQNSITGRQAFQDELGKLFTHFGLGYPNWDHVEQLRKTWLQSFEIGFNQTLNKNKEERNG
jgi:hypothetical protein